MEQYNALQLLLVEDDQTVRKIVRIACQKEGYSVQEANSGAEALRKFVRSKPDLVLLDLTLPEMDGLEICQFIRRHDQEIPIIMLTARGEESDKVVGLKSGADDYVTKPFSTVELMARVAAVLRRARRKDDSQGENDVYRFGHLVIDVTRREVWLRQKEIVLTRTQFELLSYLAANAGKVRTRDQLVIRVWGYDSEGSTRLLDSHMTHLREKIEPDPANPRYILTVRGVGYKLCPNPD